MQAGSSGRLERVLGLATLIFLLVSLVAIVLGWTPARAQGAVHTVQVENGLSPFSPTTFVATQGDTIRWTNNDGVPHNIVSGTPGIDNPDPIPDIPNVITDDISACGLGASATCDSMIALDAQALVSFFCTLHPTMVGGPITVNPASGGTASPSPTSSSSASGSQSPSPSASASGSPSPSPSASTSPSPSPSASPSPTASPTAEPSPSPTSSPGPDPIDEDRTISLKLKGRTVGEPVKARGRVSAESDSCSDDVPVRLQRKRKGKWRTMRELTTNSEGRYRTSFKGKPSKYRAIAPAASVGADHSCRRAVSETWKVTGP